VRRLGLVIWPAAIALGVAAEAAAFRWDQPGRWLPDLAVGLTFIGCGVVAWDRSRGTAALLGATGVAWFAGNFAADLLYLHRGPLVHLILAYPGWRLVSRLDRAAAGTAYLAAIVTPVWQSEAATVALAAALMAVTARGHPRIAIVAAGTVGAVLVAAALVLGQDAAVHAYEAALIAVAVVLTARLPHSPAALVADLVVELGERRSGTARDRLARALGDPTLVLGYWSVDEGTYLDDAGVALTLPPPSGRATTAVERDGAPFAVLVHDDAVLADPAIVAAVASATRLSASNVALRDEVRAQADALKASRRRLLVAADDERSRLEARLRGGPQERLARLSDALAAAPSGGNERVDRARTQLSRTLEDLHELGRGLHPRELTEAGLERALASLAERAPVPVAVEVRVGTLPAEVQAAVYYVCAEALANVAKYAQAASAQLAVTAGDGRVTVIVADDGVGGADPARGSGLQGLADRVAALGGALTVTSPPGTGTRLAAHIPAGGEAR
jgi:signal transduction histidine kinase